MLGLILSLAVILRVVAFVELINSPFVMQHRWSNTDLNFFHTTAIEIAEGDLLLNQAAHPYPNWHERVAETYFANEPGRADHYQMLEQATQKPAGVLLWDHWYGGKQFHQAPLYTYLVALTYAVLGPDVRAVILWQLGLGILSLWLLYKVTERYFGDLVATVTTLCSLFYGPLLFYELILLRSTVITFSLLLLLYLVGLILQKASILRYLCFGLVSGLSILLKSTFVIFPLAIAAAISWRLRRTPKRLAIQLAPLLIGLIIALAPCVVRNLSVGASPLGMSSVGAITYINSNLDSYRAERGFRYDVAESARIMGEVEGRFMPAVIQTLRTHKSASSIARQNWQKILKIFHWYEHPNNANFYFYREHILPLRLAGLPFTLLAPLSLLGILVWIRRIHIAWPLLLWIFSVTVPLLIFYTVSRFRVPLVAISLPFAGWSLVWLTHLILRQRWAISLACLCGIVLMGLWITRPLPETISKIRFADHIQPYALAYAEKTLAAESNEQWAKAAGHVQEALWYAPSWVRGEAEPQHISQQEKLGLSKWFVELYLKLCWYYFELNDFRQALNAAQRVDALDPQNKIEIFYTLGSTALASGAFEESLELLRLVEQQNPDYRDTRALRALALQKIGELNDRMNIKSVR